MEAYWRQTGPTVLFKKSVRLAAGRAPFNRSCLKLFSKFAANSLIPNTSAILRRRSFGYINSEKNFPFADGRANELRLQNQAVSFTSGQ